MTDHDRLRAVGIVWSCILITLLVYGCAGERFGRPGETTYNVFDQPWPGYRNPKIIVYDNAPKRFLGDESARLAMKDGEYFILCKSICSKKEIEHEESHALAHLNGYEDETHRN